ncbi:MAG TPA: TIGR00267 family protein, partial [Candidatus Bathyarchaeota archaeon]|nr:TIGR00267 family protein [Candidatus Bathyarchaeota archaeon]
SPFLFMDVTQAIWVSIGVTLASLFIIGVYLGNISGQNVLWTGLRMVLAGIATALICMLIGHF